MTNTAAPRLLAGAMSGTSADGVDVAIVRIEGRGLDMSARLVAHHAEPYAPELRQAIFRIREGQSVRIGEMAHLSRQIALAYAAAVRGALAAANASSDELAAVAAHGQTLFHDPPDTLQLFDPSLLAAEVGRPVVSDFRRADCAAGGQGAPLVPFADYILFRSAEIDRAVVNIGGIANVTLLFKGAGIDKVLAFDTGPGNCVSDHLMRKHDPAGPGVDVDGRIASGGQVHRGLFEAVSRHAYFARPGPKSTDGPEMVALFGQALHAHAPGLPLADQLATASALTAFQIRRALSLFGGQFGGELIVSGGGIRNRAIVEHLRFFCGNLRTTDEFGVPSEAKEALAFALLGAATLDGFPSNVPSVTGARRPVVLGSVTPKP